MLFPSVATHLQHASLLQLSRPKTTWNEEEDALLIQLNTEGKTWSEIAAEVPGNRLPRHIKKRLQYLSQ